MILLPPVPAPKIKGIDPEMLKVHSVLCLIYFSLLYVISNVTAEWTVLHRAVITAAHTCFECCLPRKVIIKVLCHFQLCFHCYSDKK